MASLFSSGNLFGISNGNFIEVFDLSNKEDEEGQQLTCEKPKPEQDVKEDVKKEGSKDEDVKDEDVKKDVKKEGSKKKDVKEKDDKAKIKAEEGSERILACGVSPDGQRIAACDDHKQLWVWTRQAGGRFTLHTTREVSRRATSLAFTQDGSDVLVADKSGDVCVYSLLSDNEGKLLMGHVSMLLDIVLVGADDSLVVTCDRDEKIRVSHYPNAYSIQAFCLGHAEFVSRLGTFAEQEILISGSGDGTVKLWNYLTGKQLYSLDLTTEFPDNTSQSECTEQSQSSESISSKVAEEGDGIMSRTKGKADVKCLACCQNNKFIAVGVDKKDQLLLLKLNKNSSDEPELHIKQRINIPSGDIWSLHFDSTGALWVVEANGSESVRVFVHNSDADEYEALRAEQDARGALRVVDLLNSRYHALFTADQAPPNNFAHLHKVRIDNMAEYQERKQARIQQQRGKRSHHNDASGNDSHTQSPHAKAAKNDTDVDTRVQAEDSLNSEGCTENVEQPLDLTMSS